MYLKIGNETVELKTVVDLPSLADTANVWIVLADETQKPRVLAGQWWKTEQTFATNGYWYELYQVVGWYPMDTPVLVEAKPMQPEDQWKEFAQKYRKEHPDCTWSQITHAVRRQFQLDLITASKITQKY